MHLRWRAFEEAAAATAEQRIAAEHGPVARVGNVPARMTGHVEYREGKTQRRQFHAGAALHRVSDAFDVFVAGPEDGERSFCRRELAP
jgi:hypothetical protein